VKIVVFTYDRYETISTPAALEEAGVDYEVVCHTQAQYDAFDAAGRVNMVRMWVSGAPKGLANNRNAWIDARLKDGEWALMLCDDFMYVTEFDAYDSWPKDFIPIDTTITTHWNRRLRCKVDVQRFLERAVEIQKKCEQHGFLIGGFAGNDNSLFRKAKWKTNVLVDGRAIIMKKTALRFDVNAQMVDDVAFSALNIERGGGTLINQWVLPDFQRYTKGSFGSIATRLEQRRRECAYLVRRFPGLICYGTKPGWPEGTHVRIRWMVGDRLKNWRDKNHQLGPARFLNKSLPASGKKF
jgi:hypothetical protein